MNFIDTFASALTLYHLQPQTFTSLVETSISHRPPPSSSFLLNAGPPLPVISLSPSSARILKLWHSIAPSSSSRRPLPEIIAVNYSPSWRDTLPLTKDAGLVAAGLKLMQRLMRKGPRREWEVEGGEDRGEEEEVRIFRRDRWVVERKEGQEGGGRESWFMDLKGEEKVAGREKK